MEADALAKVRGAVSILQEALPSLEIGGEPHKAVLQAISSLAKISPASQMPVGVQETMFQGLAQQAAQTPMLQQLQQFQQQNGGQDQQPPMQGM